jgi:hypothetical protein
MKVSGVLLSAGALLQGVVAQQEFLNKLPACAVRFAQPISLRPTLILHSVQMRPRNCNNIRMLAQ